MNKYDIERMKRLTSNEDLVIDLMNYSPYGGLGQVFIVEAIRQYAEQIAAADPSMIGNGLISGEAWQGVAKDVQERCNHFYNRHIREDHDDLDEDANADEIEFFHPND